MNEHEPTPKKISRREALLIIALASLVGGATIARSCLSKDNKEELSNSPGEPESNRLPKQSPEDLQPFVPSIEIAAQIDSETFKAITEELFVFANETDAGKVNTIGKIPQTNRLAWERLIPFKKEGKDQNMLHLRWGYRMTEQIGTLTPDLTAREIAIGRFNFGLGIPFTSFRGILTDPKEFVENLKNSKIVNYTKEGPPRQFWPAPPDPEKKSPFIIVKPMELSSDQLASSLKEIVDYFNLRIAIPKKNPEIDLGKIV